MYITQGHGSCWPQTVLSLSYIDFTSSVAMPLQMVQRAVDAASSCSLEGPSESETAADTSWLRLDIGVAIVAAGDGADFDELAGDAE